MTQADPDLIRRRLQFRAWHRGTKEADMMIGGFADRYMASWGPEELAWFEALLHEDDVDIMAWAIGTRPVPPQYDGPLMDAMKKLDFISHLG